MPERIDCQGHAGDIHRMNMPETTKLLIGTPAVPGIAAGPALVVRGEVADDVLAAVDARRGLPADALLAEYQAAATAVADRFARRAEHSSGAAAQVLTASAGLARDKGLAAAVAKRLQAGDGVVTAVRAAVEQFAALFAGLGGLMAERVTDLRDIERRLLATLAGQPEPGVNLPDVPVVLVARDFAPADTAVLDPDRALALVTEGGGPTSHTAIIARQLGIPCVVGAAGATGIAPGSLVLVDGGTGRIEVDPDPAQARRRAAAGRAAQVALTSWTGPGRTADGRHVGLLANVADGDSARESRKVPVEGVGLFRTELCFLDRLTEPPVAEQAELYGEVLAAYAGHGHVVVRTLDAGSDKPIAFATHAGEENPALGVRGLRLAHDNPGLLERQLDAIALAAQRSGTDTWVMAPMVATVDEAAAFAALVRARGLRPGVMVEVPSAALMADPILREVDFLSVGTNDLTQYTMAADRTAADLARLTDPWQPAVLQLVAMTARAGQRAGKPVGVCGEAAADPLLACVLAGLGITSLSMAPAAVRAVGARLASVSHDQCAAAAAAACAAGDVTAALA
jgi:phosphotransferase system enzyme I (PtsI)